MRAVKPEPKKDPQMKSLYEFEARSKEARKYFKIKKPTHWYKK